MTLPLPPPPPPRLLLHLIFEEKLPEVRQLAAQFPTLDFLEPTLEMSPLQLAVDTSSAEIIEYLLQQGAAPNFANAQTLPLLLAIERSIYDTIYCTDTGEWVEKENETWLVELLLNYGADCQLQDPTGRSAYEFAQASLYEVRALFDKLLAGPAG